MATATSKRRYTTLIVYLVAIGLINVVSVSLFARFDLTQSRAFSLSPISGQVIAQLSDPLTIKVFFTENLPAPHNGTERYLRDLLDEYALSANRNFNFQFYAVSPEADGVETAVKNRKLAAEYGIHPVQIQVVENDEVKFKNAYMGLVILHGDAIDRIPTITSTAGLEYRITTAIQKMQNKISALLALEDDIKINLFMSSSLNQVAPFMGLKQLPELPAQVEQLVARLNPKHYNRLTYSRVDPATADQMDKLSEDAGLLKLEWQAIDQANVPAGAGAIGMTVSNGENTVGFRLLNVLRIPVIGTRYELATVGQMEEMLSENIEKLLNINENIGGISGHGSILDPPPPGPPNQRRPAGANNFRTLLSDRYTISSVDPSAGPIPSSLKSVIIARPTQPLDDYALYQIDQALMRGTNLIFFVDAFKEDVPAQPQFSQARGPQYTPMNTGLEAMLAHYGVTIEPAYVLDENCFKQPRPQNMGGGETPIYFAPLIRNQGINQDVDFLKNIRGMLAVKVSPLVVDAAKTTAAGIIATPLLSTSDLSWKMTGRINLDPRTIVPPPAAERTPNPAIAYLLEGKFPSFFAGKPIPERPAPSEAEPAAAPADASAMVATSGNRRDAGAPARIFVMASSEMIADGLIDGQDKTGPNSVFVMNVIDALSGRGDIAQMRAKQQTFNPLDVTDPGTKTAIKTTNVAGLPVLMILAGLVVMAMRHGRKRRIQAAFAAQGE